MEDCLLTCSQIWIQLVSAKNHVYWLSKISENVCNRAKKSLLHSTDYFYSFTV